MARSKTNLTLLSAVLAAALSSSASFANDPLALRYYEDAVSRFNQNDLGGAEIQLKNALQRDPSQLPARILMGRLQLAQGNAQQAEEELQLAEQLGADRVLLALPLTQARNRQGKYAVVIEQLVPTLYPLDMQPDLWVELGIARFNTKDKDGAVIAFEQALSIQPLHQKAMVALAQVPLSEGNYAEALRRADNAIANDSEDTQAWFLRGSALHALGKPVDAAEAYGRARDLDPDNAPAGLGEAAALIDSGKNALAIAVLEDMRSKFPLMVEVQFLLSQQYRQLGRDEDAKEAITAVSDLIEPIAVESLVSNPPLLRLAGAIAAENDQLERAYKAVSLYLDQRSDDIAARKLMARIANRMDKPREAKRALVPIVSNGQADAETLALLGDTNAKLGDYLAAESYYREAISNYQGGAALIGRLGAMQYRRGLRERAMETFEEAIDEHRGYVPTGISLYAAMVNMAEGRLDAARAITDTLVEREPGNPIVANLQAALMIMQGDDTQAEAILRELLRQDPTFMPARYNLAKVYALTQREDLARSELARLLAEDPEDKRALLQTARLARSVGDTVAAEQSLKKILEIDRANAIPAVELVDLYIRTNRPAEAAAVASDLTQALPNSPLSHHLLGRVQVFQGDTEGAKANLRKAAQFAGDDRRWLLSIARFQSQAGAHKDAEISIRRALINQSDNVQARIQLARVLFRQGNLASAQEQVDQILKAESNSVYALALLGDIQMAQRSFADAAVSYEKAYEIATFPQVAISRFRARTLAGDSETALNELIGTLDTFPSHAPIVRAVAERLHQLDRVEEAHSYYSRLIELKPDDAHAHNNLSILLNRSDSESAFKAARRAYELAPTDPSILDTYGWALVQIGELEKGLALLRESVARDGRSAFARYHLGVALEEYGSAREARRQIEEALSLNAKAPWSEDAVRRLQRLP